MLKDWIAALTAPPAAPGLVRCAACGELAAPRGNHLSLHYPSASARLPCDRSWPTPKKATP